MSCRQCRLSRFESMLLRGPPRALLALPTTKCSDADPLEFLASSLDRSGCVGVNGEVTCRLQVVALLQALPMSMSRVAFASIACSSMCGLSRTTSLPLQCIMAQLPSAADHVNGSIGSPRKLDVIGRASPIKHATRCHRISSTSDRHPSQRSISHTIPSQAACRNS